MSKFFGLRMRYFCMVAATAAMLPNPAVLGGTIRHDRSDQLYRAGAKSPQLEAVVRTLHLSSSSGGGCSGTLIAPNWVLTASHCVWPKPQDEIRSIVRIYISGQTIDVGPEDIFINPGWISSFSTATTIGDIALIRLPRPITHVTPIGLNTSSREVGKLGYIAGFGTSGTGRTGNVNKGTVKRIGPNVIDATEARVTFASKYPVPGASVGSARALLTDFDDPQRSASTLGDRAPLNMEYTSAEGDSGGPLLLYENGTFTVAGVVSGGIDGFFGTSPFYSYYSDVATFSRVVSYRQWIQSVMNGNAPSLRQMAEGFGTAEAAEARRRVAERDLYYRRHGIRVQSRQGVVGYLPPRPPRVIEPFVAGPRRGILGLVNDAAENVRKMAEQADREDPPIVYFDCESCGQASADD